MTLDEAIKDAKAFVKKCEDPEIKFRVAQVAEWLRQARVAEKAARWYTTRIWELEEACDEYADLIHEICDLDAYGKLKAENERLRELTKRMYAEFQRVFPDGHRIDFEQNMRELGIEVD